MNTPSNPSPCQHSMVTDLCGLCIRDNRIAELEKQRDELLKALDLIASWGEGETVTSSFDEPHSARIARDAIAKYGGQHD